MRPKNTLVGAILAIVVLLGIFIGFGFSGNLPTDTPQPTASATPAKSYTFNGIEGQTALVILKTKQSVETKSVAGQGEYITSINSLSADATHFWSLYVNGAEASAGADSYITKAGDTVEFRYVAL